METLTFREPRIIALILLVVMAAGFSSMATMGRQEDPTITNLFATVKTVYPGADPARVEALVTAEIERELRTIPEIDIIESTSSTGMSIVGVELDATVPDDEIEGIWAETRDALDDARARFPDGVLAPEFDSDGAGAYAAIIALTTRQDPVPQSIAGRYAEELADRLRNIPGTELVDLFGVPEEEVLITLRPDDAAALGLTAQAVAQAVSAADSKVQSGRVRGDENDLLINVEGEITALDRLRDIVVRRDADGRVTRLADIAEISRGPRQPMDEKALNDGRPAILIAAKINEGLQVDRWTGHLSAELADFQPLLPVGLTAELVFDQSHYTADRLVEVAENMAIGVALVVIVLFVTLGLRAALIVTLVLPIVSLASLASMNAIGLPIHQMSVTGLIVALGLLVDAAIVMTDEIQRRLTSGQARVDAVRAAVRRLFAPLFASTLTTALSFTPMILLPGGAGDFVGSIALAVVLMLVWSFIIAIIVTPALAGRLLSNSPDAGFLTRGISAGLLGRAFAATLRVSVHHPVKSMMVALVLPVSGFLAFPSLTSQFFPGVDRDQFYLEIELANGGALSETLNVTQRIDALLRAEEDIRAVSWVVGGSAPAFYYNIVGNRERAPEFAQGLITTASPEATERLVPELQRRFDTAFPEARVLVRGLVQGPPVAAPVELRFVGPDLTVLRELGDEARRILAGLDMVTVVRTSANGGAPKVSVEVDEAKARLVGLDLGEVAAQLQAGLEGATGGSLIEATEQLPVRVRFGDTLRGDLTAIADMVILPPDAAERSAAGAFPGVPLSALADIKLIPAESVVTRRNAERVNTVQAFITRGVLPEEALKAARLALAEQGFDVPPGYRMELGGDSDARNDTMNNLLAPIGLIVTLTIASVVLTFRSFRLSAITMVVAGLSAGSSFLALAAFGYPFGIQAVIGLIGAIGVSLNAALIILTALQEDPRASAGDKEAAVRVVSSASRHIVSTTITTFGGFLPLILEGGGFWPPFAMAIAGGVVVSSAVSFYFVPAAFTLVWRKRRHDIEQPVPVGAAVA